MKWEVSIRKSLESGGHRFELDVAFTSSATRLVLFGPSGAGKSLTLKAIAGLLQPDHGRIALDGEPLFDAQAQPRLFELRKVQQIGNQLQQLDTAA